tara:strand:+ start:2104 stop:3294 length:1191 start_codon:yes stop_codon:yes gene_type:complete
MKILDFNEWNEAIKLAEEMKETVDSIEEGVQYELLLEGLSSGILKSIFSARFGSITYGRSKSFNKMAKDFYAKYKVDLNSIQDTDFETMRSPSKSETKGLFKDAEKLCFWINEDPKFVRSYIGRKGETSSTPALILVTKGPNALVSGFSTNSDFARYKKDPLGFVGANKWEKEEYSFTGLPVTSTSKAAYHEMTTTLYCLDIPSLQEKYSTEGKIKARAKSREGAVAMISQKQVRDENAARYKQLIANKLDPKSIMEDISKAMTIASDVYKDIFTKLDDVNVRFKPPGDSWGRDIGDTIRNIASMASSYARDYSEYSKYTKAIEVAAEISETGKFPKGIDLNKHDSFYLDRLENQPEKAPEMIEKIKFRLDDSLRGLSSYKGKVSGYIKALETYNK